MDTKKYRSRFYSQQLTFAKKSKVRPITPVLANLELDLKDIEEMDEIELAPSTHFDSLKNDFGDDFEIEVGKFEKKRSYSY
ncbi:MAG: hypothetical protein DHS20C13_30300 [Thermodesulfobacteriota bacterium]|nr:MAG: hypothetical protein DHS20C13_30300 [Thermodesulfobacteriota bacterium]